MASTGRVSCSTAAGGRKEQEIRASQTRAREQGGNETNVAAANGRKSSAGDQREPQGGYGAVLLSLCY